MSDILLTTINARFIHTAFGLRYLKSNLLELKDFCEIQEFTIQQDPAEIVAAIMAANPKILGLGSIFGTSPILRPWLSGSNASGLKSTLFWGGQRSLTPQKAMLFGDWLISS